MEEVHEQGRAELLDAQAVWAQVRSTRSLFSLDSPMILRAVWFRFCHGLVRCLVLVLPLFWCGVLRV